MREPIAQPLTIDGALLSVRNESLCLNALGLRGVIVLWSGANSVVPPGWGLCDGTQGTPDLRDRFVVGARVDVIGVAKCSLTGSPTQSGGSSHDQQGKQQHPGTAGQPSCETLHRIPH